MGGTLRNINKLNYITKKKIRDFVTVDDEIVYPLHLKGILKD